MSPIRLILLGLVALIATTAMGAFASASASATTPVYLVCSEKSGSGTKYTESNCAHASGSGKWEAVEVTKQAVSGTAGLATFRTTLLGNELIVTCKKAVLAGEIEAKGSSHGEITFKECDVGNSKETFINCEVPNISFHLDAQLIENSKSEIEEEFKPEREREIFVEVIIKNKEAKSCLERGTYPIAGTQKCKFSNEREFETSRKIECLPAGSDLKFSSESATFEAIKNIETPAGDAWAVE